MNPGKAIVQYPRSRWKDVLASALALLTLFAIPIAHAHLMPAQRGTLNVVDDGAFMALSLPVSAFSSVDENADGQWSMIEFNAHRGDIIKAVRGGVSLSDEQGLRPLEGVMLSPVLAENNPAAVATQLMVLGRFALANIDPNSALHIEMTLFGTGASENTIRLTAIRKSTDQMRVLELTPASPGAALFSSAWQVFLGYAALGVEHIVTGLDHLLFLLVVLATGWSWRHVFWALTTFTVGHAISLLIVVRAELSVPAGVVEPAIAATIVGMALFDILVRRFKWVPSSLLRLSLVFACSLVHGLGLSSALTDLGLDKQPQLPRLAGFNIGVELGQLAIAMAAGALALGVFRLRGKNAVLSATRTGSFAAVAIGSAWFFQRVMA